MAVPRDGDLGGQRPLALSGRLEGLAPLLGAAGLIHAFLRLSRPLPGVFGQSGSALLLVGLLAAVAYAQRSRRALPLPTPAAGAAALSLGALGVLQGDGTDVLAACLCGAAVGLGSWRGALQLVAVGLGVHAVLFRLTLAPTPYTALQRFSGWTGDPNDAALVALLALLPSLLRATTAERLPLPALDVAAVVGGATAVALTQSRLALVALAVALAWRLAVVARGRPMLALSGVVGAALGVAFLPQRFWFRFFRLLEGRDLGMREHLLQTATDAFAASPWTGVGVGRFPALSGGLAPHSLLLEAMAEGGVFHLTLLTVGAAALWHATRHAAADARLLARAALALALVAPMDARVLWISVAVGLSASLVSDVRSPPHSSPSTA